MVGGWCWWWWVVSKPILVISLKFKSRLINSRSEDIYFETFSLSLQILQKLHTRGKKGLGNKRNFKFCKWGSETKIKVPPIGYKQIRKLQPKTKYNSRWDACKGNRNYLSKVCFWLNIKQNMQKKIGFNQTLPNFAFSWMGDFKVEKDLDKAYLFLGF